MRSHPISDKDFAHVVRHAPLISIDLVLREPQGHVLVGLRANEPAKDFYFVPGGRIRKNETLAAAFRRILADETGCHADLTAATLLGAYEHLYETNRFGAPDYGTHYVVLGYELVFDHRPAITSDRQHTDMRWMPVAEILSSPAVHENTKAYFRR